MKKIYILILVILLSCFIIEDAASQSRRRSSTKKKRTRITEVKRDKKPSELLENVYVGAYINSPRLSSGNSVGTAQFGLSPFVGYEFNDWLSAGPIFKINYSYFWISGDSVSAWDLGAGAFARAIAFRRLIIQIEGGYSTYNRVYTNLYKEKLSFPTFFGGLGWNFSDGPFTQEILLLYDFSDNLSQNDIFPFNYRLGFRYSF